MHYEMSVLFVLYNSESRYVAESNTFLFRECYLIVYVCVCNDFRHLAVSLIENAHREIPRVKARSNFMRLYRLKF